MTEFGFNRKAYEALPLDLRRTLGHAAVAAGVSGLTEFEAKNAIALEKLKTEFKGKVEVLQLPAPVLRDLKKLAAEVVKEESEKSPMARKVYAAFRTFQRGSPPGPTSRKARTSSSWRREAERRVRLVLAALLLVGPLAAEAQPFRRPSRIGVINEAFAATHPTVEGLKGGLREAGLAEGRDVTFDIRFTEGDAQATRAAAAALVKGGVDLIVTSQDGPTQAAKDATKTVPIVFTLVGDPVASGSSRTSPSRTRTDGRLEPPDRADGQAPRGPEDAGAGPPARLADPLRR